MARVAYGFGGGSGKKANEGDEGGGGGGGVSASPVGVVEITENGTRFISFTMGKKLAAASLIGLLAGFWIGRKRS